MTTKTEKHRDEPVAFIDQAGLDRLKRGEPAIVVHADAPVALYATPPKSEPFITEEEIYDQLYDGDEKW